MTAHVVVGEIPIIIDVFVKGSGIGRIINKSDRIMSTVQISAMMTPHGSQTEKNEVIRS